MSQTRTDHGRRAARPSSKRCRTGADGAPTMSGAPSNLITPEVTARAAAEIREGVAFGFGSIDLSGSLASAEPPTRHVMLKHGEDAGRGLRLGDRLRRYRLPRRSHEPLRRAVPRLLRRPHVQRSPRRAWCALPAPRRTRSRSSGTASPRGVCCWISLRFAEKSSSNRCRRYPGGARRSTRRPEHRHPRRATPSSCTWAVPPVGRRQEATSWTADCM